MSIFRKSCWTQEKKILRDFQETAKRKKFIEFIQEYMKYALF